MAWAIFVVVCVIPFMATLVELPASLPCCVASSAASIWVRLFWLSRLTSSIEADSSAIAAAMRSAPFFWFSALRAISWVVLAICSAVAESSVEPLDTPSTLSPTVANSCASCLTIMLAMNRPRVRDSRRDSTMTMPIIQLELVAVTSFACSISLAWPFNSSFKTFAAARKSSLSDLTLGLLNSASASLSLPAIASAIASLLVCTNGSNLAVTALIWPILVGLSLNMLARLWMPSLPRMKFSYSVASAWHLSLSACSV